ncbi:MAG: hypothetical protein KDC43_13985 [Saprospiraceae bacterium]|nr:hypothetical protein [Saprospiraceae bacterium]MCB0624983.1 hypothetical protein [Saprospiraceae bacterium]MCB0676208.1 hypothetical protein [Saprospiraceae bacterium]MCB0682964.1 hypothetical protein [Saprospiraceae bacterium]
MVEFDLPEEMNEEFLRLVPEQRQFINYLLAEGKVQSYSLALDRSRLWIVMVGKTELDIIEVIDRMPLQAYLDPSISELAFHNKQEHVLQFSLN